MRYEIQYGPSFALAVIFLEPGEAIQAEADAMVSMSEGIRIETSTRGGVVAGLKRSLLGGESFFVNTFTAERPGHVTIAPSLPGDILALQVVDQPLFVQSGSFLAATPGVKLDTTWGGAKTFFSREGLFLLKCTGQGTVWVSSYGAIHEVNLQPGERYTVDTGHMVAFDSSVRYEVGRVGGLKSTLFSGEGLVCKLTGPGRFYLQTRAPSTFLSWLSANLPGKRQ